MRKTNKNKDNEGLIAEIQKKSAINMHYIIYVSYKLFLYILHYLSILF